MKDAMIHKIHYLLMFSGLGVSFMDILPPLQVVAVLITIFLGGLKIYDRFKK